MRVYNTMADGMKGHSAVTTFAFWYGMVPLDARAKRTIAERTGRLRLSRNFFSDAVFNGSLLLLSLDPPLHAAGWMPG